MRAVGMAARRFRPSLAVALVLLLANCASGGGWVKPGGDGTPDEFARVKYVCQVQATYMGQSPETLAETLAGLAVNIGGVVHKAPLTTQRYFAEAEAARARRAPVPLVNEDLYKACLEAYGWREGR
jgi:hypothetical protein